MTHEYKLLLGNILILVRSEYPLEASDGTKRYLCSDTDISKYSLYMVNVSFHNDGFVSEGECIGENMMFDYYRKGQERYYIAKSGTDGSIVMVRYRLDLREIWMQINEEAFPGMIRTLDKVFQLMPATIILAQENAFVLHSSNIRYKGQSILFTAPSGTGKSTQANLWEAYENAEVLCNDRTMIREEESGVCTYGFPVDGSSPVYRNEKSYLSAIVVLSQAKDNSIERLTAFRSLKYLIDQTIFEHWDGEIMQMLHSFWMSILEKVPVYLLSCTPDQCAVDCLKNKLKEDGYLDGDD